VTYEVLNAERPKESLAEKAQRLSEEAKSRRFEVWRDEDVSGISGVGKIAEGIQFSDGQVVTYWLNQPPMFEPKVDVWIHSGIDPFEKIHSHGGRTRVVWLDPEQPSSVQ
jgi:hypothetical protein